MHCLSLLPLSVFPSRHLSPVCWVREVDCKGAWIYVGGRDMGSWQQNVTTSAPEGASGCRGKRGRSIALSPGELFCPPRLCNHDRLVENPFLKSFVFVPPSQTTWDYTQNPGHLGWTTEEPWCLCAFSAEKNNACSRHINSYPPASHHPFPNWLVLIPIHENALFCSCQAS